MTPEGQTGGPQGWTRRLAPVVQVPVGSAVWDWVMVVKSGPPVGANV